MESVLARTIRETIEDANVNGAVDPQWLRERLLKIAEEAAKHERYAVLRYAREEGQTMDRRELLAAVADGAHA
jgi:hypothetical protein